MGLASVEAKNYYRKPQVPPQPIDWLGGMEASYLNAQSFRRAAPDATY